MSPFSALFVAAASASLAFNTQGHEDQRTAYDVRAYRLDLTVDPEKQEIAGEVAIEVRFERHGVDVLQLDLMDHCKVTGVRTFDGGLSIGCAVGFERLVSRIRCAVGCRRDGELV